MSLPSQHGSRRSSALLILALAALAIGGCGSSHSSGTEADPAGAVPASTPLYAGATVRPSEPLKAAARTAGKTLSHQADVYLRLLAALQTPGSSTLTFNDLAPWLGSHAAIFLGTPGAAPQTGAVHVLGLLQQGLLGGSAATSAFPFGAAGVQGAIVLDTSDVTKAHSFLDAQAARAGGHTTTYRGVSYQATTGGIAFGVVDRFAVIGSESGLRSVIDTTLGAPSLAHATGYSRLIAAAPPGVLAHVYASPSAFGSSRGAPAASPGLASLLSLLAGINPVNISLVPTAASIALDADALSSGAAGSHGGLLSASPEGAQALGELPGESWLAVGLGNVGTTLGEDVKGLHALTSIGSAFAAPGAAGKSTGGLSVSGLLEGILAPLSVLSANTAEAKRDFASWMSSAGMFASGAGLLELKGGIVIGSKNPALSRAAVAKLAAKLREAGGSVQAVSIAGTDASVAARLTGLPVVLDIADGRDANGHAKFVIGLGEPSIVAALNPSSTLSGSAARAAASAALGEGIQPSVSVEFPTLLGLLESVGLSEDPSVSPFVPYLRSLTTLAGGGKSLGGGIERFRLLVGLH
jgi:hypothetical protein